MGLFTKKYTPDQILELINDLPEEERSELKAKFDDLYKAEDEREIDKIEEEKTDSPETSDEKAEEVTEESEEIGKDVDEIENVGTEDAEKADETPEDAAAPEADTEPKEEIGEQEGENIAEIVHTLSDKVNSLETQLAELAELKAKMDEYVSKQKDSFGYHSDASDKGKDFDDMSAEELKHQILYK